MQSTLTTHCSNQAAIWREFEVLFARSYRQVYRVAYRLTGNAADAEDATQETFVRAWGGLRRYDRNGPFEAWLFRILTNVVIDRFRRRKRIPPFCSLDAQLVQDAEGKPLSVEIADSSSDPEKLMLSHEFGETVQRALAELPEVYRVAVVLAAEEHSYEEIASIMQTNLGTVRSRIHRGRQMLRPLLKESANS